MNQQFFLSALAFGLTASVVVAPIPLNAQTKQFSDVPASYPYYQEIQEMQGKDIIHGYTDGTFKPNQTISRQHAAVLVVRALQINHLALPKKKTFQQPKDLQTNHPYYNEIKTLIEADLLQTDSSGNIQPTKPITRGEMAKILAVAFSLKGNTNFTFQDVKGTGFEAYVKALYSNGVTTGYEDGTFKPNQSLTRGHYSVFLYRAMKQTSVHVTPESLGLVPAFVSRVVDGDTVELTDGNKVRLIGVNTPESTTRTEEYGKEASAYTKAKLEGKKVYLQKDVSETDQYGRLLRFVWLEVPTDVMNEQEIRTKMFNADLVLNGYAQPSTYAPDVTYSEFFRQFAREAREKNKGLWSYNPNGTTKGDPLDSGSTTNSNNYSNSGNSKVDFKNCTELREVYPDGVSKSHPAYQKKFDRDEDGWACER